VDRRDQIWGGFDRGAASIAGRRVQIWGGFDRGAASITGRLRSGEGSWSGSGAAERVRAEKESREREQKKSREGEQRGESRTRVLGKWFTENFSVNRFPFFPSRFYGQKQRFSV
jgi:hypothetical protein